MNMTYQKKSVATKVGICIAVHNTREITRECLLAVLASKNIVIYPVVIDDGSEDGTWEMLLETFPQIKAIRGDGNLWWTRATNLAIKECIREGCSHMLLLNPDAIIQPHTIHTLVQNSQELDDAIVAPVVLNHDVPDTIWEAGHDWLPIFKLFPYIWVPRYKYKRGTALSNIPTNPYSTVSIVGRGGLIPRKAFEVLGYFDEVLLPHYGADMDYALRAFRNSYPMYIIPKAHVLLYVHQTGMSVANRLPTAIAGYLRMLTKKKHGALLFTYLHVAKKNLPIYSALLTYVFTILLNSFRFWQAFAKRSKQGS